MQLKDSKVLKYIFNTNKYQKFKSLKSRIVPYYHKTPGLTHLFSLI